jgi:cytochrome c oxidase cbb3-type subunit 3
MRNLVTLLACLFPLGLAAAALAQAPAAPSADADPLMNQAVSHLQPGGAPPSSDAKNPLANDAQAATRGMSDFVNLNCVGCHAANAGGGMGPSLSVSQRTYGDQPGQLFLSIYQGRPNGMPAWGQTLPQSTIWELVAYIQSLTHAPATTFGETISRSPMRPDIEQVPAEFQTTVDPWSYTERFSDGQAPKGEGAR